MTGRWEDREAIRDVASRYCRGLDRLDAACMRSAYWPDATDDHGTFVGSGWDFVDRCMISHTRWRSTLHCISNHSIDLSNTGPQGTGESYIRAYLFPLDVAPVQVWFGRYLDVYDRRGAEWRILRRVYVPEGTALIEAATPSSITLRSSHGANSPGLELPVHASAGLGGSERLPDGGR